MSRSYLFIAVLLIACAGELDGVVLPCHPIVTVPSEIKENIVRFTMSTAEKVWLQHGALDTILDLDSTLHAQVFDLLEDDLHFYLVKLKAALYLDKHLPLEVHDRLKNEIRKSGILYYRMMGCNDQRIDLYVLPITDQDGYHDPNVAARLPPPPPPLPDLDTFLLLPSTVIARLHPREQVLEDPSGNRINDLVAHIRTHERVMHFYQGVKGSTYDDLFRFYSVVFSAIEEVRGVHDDDDPARLARKRYPLMISQHPQANE